MENKGQGKVSRDQARAQFDQLLDQFVNLVPTARARAAAPTGRARYEHVSGRPGSVPDLDEGTVYWGNDKVIREVIDSESSTTFRSGWLVTLLGDDWSDLVMRASGRDQGVCTGYLRFERRPGQGAVFSIKIDQNTGGDSDDQVVQRVQAEITRHLGDEPVRFLRL